MSTFSRFTFSLAGLGVLPAVAIAQAQAPTQVEPDRVEEVIVTADFRAADLMRAPASISVLGELEMAERGARHLEDVLSAAPNVSWSAGASRSRFLQVRGVGDLEQYAEPKYYPSVGVVVDDLELGSAASAGMLFDAAQVEVLRGPQGTRYGAAAHAGMVRIETNAPGDDFEAQLHGGVGNYGSYHAGLVLSGPLGPTLGARLAVQQNTGDGYVDNAFSGEDDTAGYDEFTGRARLRWQPTDNASYELSGLRFDSDNGYDAFTLDNSRTSWADQPGSDAQEIDAVTARGDWLLGGGRSLQAIASWLDGDQLYAYDADWVSPPVCELATCSYGFDTAQERFDRGREQGTLELRLLGGADTLGAGDLRYVIGLYANHNDETLDYAYPSAWYGLYESSSGYDTERYAVYGQLEYGFSERLSLKAGLRLERFSDDYADSNGVATDSDDDLLDAEISLQYEFDDNTFLYATTALASKPGSVNVAASSQFDFMSPGFQDFMQDKLRFDSEQLVNYEIGLKTRQWNGRLDLRTALFYVTRDNAQLENWMWDADAGLWVGYLDSGSDAENYGLELEGSLALTQQLEVYGSLGLLETEVDTITTFDLDRNAFVTKDGRDQAKSPAYQYNLGLRAALPLGLTASLEVEGRDDSYFGYYHDGQLEGYDLVNASLGWSGRSLRVTLWGRNLGDEDYAVHGLYFGADPRDDFGAWSNQSYYQLGAPRTYGVDLVWTL
ncbi:TonB-dependent receptor [Mangrovimicrobium sediminis]|uniref:TonB-dependent receptor n=1 Tax=Mangrovimicrobium sediminis TaxID=2562682 RepID=A0A4Z0M2A5_9GAMM|nr:TonB-dependent receptor [Haliea sp. SAOS-164]TGD73425.1 TonB-dependent receptor [Haliea sp. SAOS-164]